MYKVLTIFWCCYTRFHHSEVILICVLVRHSILGSHSNTVLSIRPHGKDPMSGSSMRVCTQQKFAPVVTITVLHCIVEIRSGKLVICTMLVLLNAMISRVWSGR